VHYLIDRFCQDFNKLAPSRSMHAEETLVKFEWFGDVKDLQNYIEHAVVLCETREVQPTTSTYSPTPTVVIVRLQVREISSTCSEPLRQHPSGSMKLSNTTSLF